MGLLIVAAATGAAALLLRSGLDLPRLQQVVSELRLWGTAFQTMVVGLIGITWRRLVEAGLRRGIVLADEFEQVLAVRSKVLAFLVAYLLLVPIGPSTLLRMVM